MNDPNLTGPYQPAAEAEIAAELRQHIGRYRIERLLAELLLADRAAVWNARPENRQLPSLLQWLQIRWHTRKKDWTPPQRKMMEKAGRYHALRAGIVAVVLVLATFTGLTIRD